MDVFHPRDLRIGSLPALLAVFLMVTLPQPLIAQQDSLKAKTPDPVQIPTSTSPTAAGDSSGTSGAGEPRKHPPEWGSLGREIDSSRVLDAKAIRWIERISFGDVAEAMPGIWMRDQQSAGQYNALNGRGMDWRGVAFIRNGRLMNDPASGIYNPFHVSVDDLAGAEIISGSRAFAYALNSTGASVNLLSRSFFSSRPYTRIAYVQGPYEYSFTDGIYSQNILRALNLHVGFQGQSTSGRLPNSAHGAWNLRTRLTYHFADDFSLTLSEYYTGSKTRMNGGLRSTQIDPTVPVASAIVNTDSYEKLTRHDVDMTLAARLFADSADVSTLTLYYSHNLREYRDEELGTSPNGIYLFQDHRSSWMGVQFQQLFSAGPQKLSFGAGLEIRQIEGSPTLGRRRNVIGNVRAVEELLFIPSVTLGLFGRYDRYLNGDHFGAGTDARLQVTDELTALAGFSVSERLPTYSELFWTDPSVTRSGEIGPEGHTVGEAGLEYRPVPGTEVRLTYGVRSISDPILFTATGAPNGGTPTGHGALYPGFLISAGPTVTTHTIEAGLSAQIWYVLLEGTLLWTMQQRDGASDPDIYPEIAARGGIYFRANLFKGGLDLKTGFQGAYQSDARGAYFDQVALAYAENPGERAAGGASVNFLLTAGIGDAVVYFTWENLVDGLWYRTPYHPIRDRGIRFGLAWEFLD
jgi:hypothetical protein